MNRECYLVVITGEHCIQEWLYTQGWSFWHYGIHDYWAMSAPQKGDGLTCADLFMSLHIFQLRFSWHCHIGLRGKYFCCACWVKRSNTQDDANLPNIQDDDIPKNSPAPSVPASKFENTLLTSPQHSAFENIILLSMSELPLAPTSLIPNIHAPKHGKYKESMTTMFNCISAFVKVIYCN